MKHKKVSFDYLVENYKRWDKAVIVFTEDSFNKKYPVESRSYEVFSDAKYFDPLMISKSLYGYCLDGSENGVRLDWYMFNDWKIDYCYIVEWKPIEEQLYVILSSYKNDKITEDEAVKQIIEIK